MIEMRRPLRLLGLAWGLAGLVDCGADAMRATTEPPPTAPTLTELQSAIFTPRCATQPGCHSPASPQFGLNLSAGHTYASAVNVASLEKPPLNRITPGNATDSYLYMKVTGDPRILGARMPYLATPLTDDQIAALRAWIEAGAQDN